MPSCEIIKPGLYASLQDKGRVGMAYYAIPSSGVMDRQSAKLANALVGNPPTNPVIECCLSGPSIKFYNPTTIALTGSPMSWAINGKSTRTNSALTIMEGDILSSKFATANLYAYIAIQGNIETTLSYKSCSVYPPAELGHQGGRPFQSGDLLHWHISNTLSNLIPVQRIFSSKIPIIKGPEFYFLSEESQELLTASRWSHIQLPPSGQPIVVLQDGQTTGGYPRIGFIDSNGLDDFNQVGLREALEFSITF